MGDALMPRATRLGDLGSRHGGHKASPVVTASPDVNVNGLGMARLSDSVAPHPHPRLIAEGSPTVFVNGRPAARLGDQIDCGGEMSEGSPDVFLDEQEPPALIPSNVAICQRRCMQQARRRGQAFVTSGKR